MQAHSLDGSLDFFYILVNFDKVEFEVSAEQIEGPNVKVFGLADENKQNVFADLLFADEVLVVHHRHLEVLAVS